jgi:alkanesulfonate monooxygenase SsuD/methylene tetrahydromethanopterin reductase-like flavin-dependent oxidoreductase (luciferase family)
LAKQLATLDRISGGRLTVRLGQGWNKNELETCGVNIKQRTLRFEEGVDIVKNC